MMVVQLEIVITVIGKSVMVIVVLVELPSAILDRGTLRFSCPLLRIARSDCRGHHALGKLT
jgi:hypothetical protein